SFDLCLILAFLFFSISRRHTRFSRDWSSDVCSSDLTIQELAKFLLRAGIRRALVMEGGKLAGIVTATDVIRAVAEGKVTVEPARSEERRVGNESRGRGWEIRKTKSEDRQ